MYLSPVRIHQLTAGELHHLLLRHSLVGAGLPEQISAPDAFNAGLERGLHSPDILPQLFEVRASHVLGSLPREHVSEFLSGLLIGAEVATMSSRFGDPKVTIVAGDALANRYQQALSAIGRQTTVVSGDNAFQTGIRSIIHAVAN